MLSHGGVSLRARPYLRLARSQVKERRTSTTASGQSASILQLALAGSVNAEFGRTAIPRHVASPAGLFLRFFEILSCFYGAVKAVTPENVVQARGAPGRLNGKDGLNRGWLRVACGTGVSFTSGDDGAAPGSGFRPIYPVCSPGAYDPGVRRPRLPQTW